MSALDRMKARAEHGSVYNLKDRAFTERLRKDYNREDITVLSDLSKTLHPAIIQTSSLSDKIDYKKLSTPHSANVKSGDLIHWKKEDSVWLVYLRRNTEDNYFLGEMKPAQFLIKWKDKNGTVYEQYGSFSREQDSQIESISYIKNVDLQFIDGKASLMMPNNEISKRLIRYEKFILGGAVWRVVGHDETTYNNIIRFILTEVEFNPSTDDEDLPNGQLTIQTEVYSNLEGLLEIERGSSIPLEIWTKRNGMSLQDTYVIKTLNCSIDNNIVTFNNLTSETATILIVSEETKVEKEYIITLSESTGETINYSIFGDATVKTALPYKYKLTQNINGTLTSIAGRWEVEVGKEVKLTISSDGLEAIMSTNNVQTITLKVDYLDNEGLPQTERKEIAVKSLYL